MNNLGELDKILGKYAEAEQLGMKVLEARRRLLGAEHPDTLVSMRALGVLYRVEGRYAEAEPLLTKALETQRRVLGNEHPATLGNLDDFAALQKNEKVVLKAPQADAEPPRPRSHGPARRA